MKKSIFTICLLGATALTACGGQSKIVDYAEGKTPSEGLEFKLESEMEAGFSFGKYVEGEEDYYVVTGLGTCKDTYVVVPSTYKGVPVKAVGDQAFTDKNCPNVKGFTLPNSIQAIGSLAFRNWGGSYEYIHANGIRCYGDGSLTATLEEVYVASQQTEYLASMAFFHGKEGASSKVWLPKTLKTVDASVFLDTSYTTILYEGTEADWAKINFTAGEFDGTDLKIEYKVAYPGIK